MMPEMRIDVAFKGEKESDRDVVQKIFDEYSRNSNDLFENNTGNVISIDTLETSNDYDIAFDLSTDGIIRVKYESEGIIFYDKEDRLVLLEQLVRMCSGCRIIDADIFEIMDIFEKSCIFRYLKCKKDEFDEKIAYLLNTVLQDLDPKKSAVFLQITDADLFSISQLQIREDIGDILIQAISTEQGDGQILIAAFATIN